MLVNETGTFHDEKGARVIGLAPFFIIYTVNYCVGSDVAIMGIGTTIGSHRIGQLPMIMLNRYSRIGSMDSMKNALKGLGDIEKGKG